MKVICIDATPGRHFAPQFKEGDILNAEEVPFDIAIDMKRWGKDPSLSYLITEYPTYNGNYSVWDKNRFAPLSDIDETEMERNIERSPIAVGIQDVRNWKVKFAAFSSKSDIGKSEFIKRLKEMAQI